MKEQAAGGTGEGLERAVRDRRDEREGQCGTGER